MTLGLGLLLANGTLSAEDLTKTGKKPQDNTTTTIAGIKWHTDYMDAYREARKKQQMLLINFVDGQDNGTQSKLERTIESDSELAKRLQTYVLLRVPTDVHITVEGESIKLLSQGAFSEMHDKAGIAVIDLAHEGKPYYGHVVSAFPFMNSKYYQWQNDYLKEIVDLPPGTLTQRTMVWAVRVHPEAPASTEGNRSVALANAAAKHSNYQARIGVQGHHNWNSRFHQVRAAAGAGQATEVVAESWPNQTMIDSCIDCVDSWRHSSGHWGAVRRRHRFFGFDIKRGRNGIWYGTGIFAN